MVKKKIVKKEDLIKYFGEYMPLAKDGYIKLDGGYSASTKDIVGDVQVQEERYYPGGSNVQVYKFKNGRELTPTRNYSEWYGLLPKSLISEKEVPDIFEIIEPVLQANMPGRYFIEKSEDYGYIYLYYPKITVTNTHGFTRDLFDLVVRIETTEQNTEITNYLHGTKFTFFEDEIITEYNEEDEETFEIHFTHPHLEQGDGSFQSFCLGGSSPVNNWLQQNCFSITAEKFELFLVILESYLSWESLEGTPYKSIATLGQESSVNKPDLSSEEIDVVVKEYFKLMSPKEIINNTFNPGLTEEESYKTELEVAKVVHKLNKNAVDLYNPLTNKVIYNQVEFTDLELPSGSKDYPDLCKAFNITPKILPLPDKKIDTNLVYRLRQDIYPQLIEKINTILNNYSI